MALYDRQKPDVALPQLEKRVSEIENTFFDVSHPVGSYLFTSKATYDPNILGGKWELKNNADPYRWERIK